ncbi:Mut7-C RNAse domain-containing protein [Parvularcula oceani]|uniref:Mut7-C RNAse domain-containing protein n=1 Tax=Parvularcula oceani TaxID=1247963 RepID=UPI0004E18622|nr:DUF5615 family PIN-like protein [Parvularcula oceani]
MRLFCDEMLVGLARWLRAAGDDTALAEPGTQDADILALAEAEDRLLVTRDRRLAGRAGRAVLLTEDRVEDQARDLGERTGLDWRAAPFTRCVVDNAPLRPATREERDAVPPQARGLPGPFRACPDCGRLYWPGSHVRRMSERLERLARNG